MGLQSLGLTVGNILSIAALLTITQQMGEVSGFMLSGGLNCIWIAVIWGGNIIVEPSVNEDKEAKRRNKKSFWGQVRS